MSDKLEIIMNKARHFCSYQERCTSEVKDKLVAWKAPASLMEKILALLKEENYLDDERFARTFASGKFRIKHWGKIRIRHELNSKGLSGDDIMKGLEEIDQEEYMKELERILTGKNKELNDNDPYRKRKKLISFVLQRGFEYDLVFQVLNSLNL